MITLIERNLHDALPVLCQTIMKKGRKIDSKILRVDRPVSVTLCQPMERCSFHGETKPSPFAFFSAGRQTIFANIEGIQVVGKQLREDKTGMPIPVNLHDTYTTFQQNQEGRIDAFIACRNSDPMQDSIITSMVQEVLAHLADAEVGILRWISPNVHIDIDAAGDICEKMAAKCDLSSPYGTAEVAPHKMIDIPMNRWIREMDTFIKLQHRGNYADLFFSNVVVPLHQAGIAAKEKQFHLAMTQLDACFATDWKRACYNWVVSQSLVTP